MQVVSIVFGIYRLNPIFLLLFKNTFLVTYCKYSNFSSFLDSLLPISVTVFSNLTNLINFGNQVFFILTPGIVHILYKILYVYV